MGNVIVRTVKAIDANGLNLFEDSGVAGLVILDAGDITGTTGKYFAIRAIRALDVNGLDLANSTGTSLFHLTNGTANVGIRTDAQFGSGEGVIGVANRGVAPSTNPTGGGVLYAESGAGKWRGSSGTVTTFANAEPHCPVCGCDYMKEFDNKQFGYFALCLVCLADELGKRDWIIRGPSRLNDAQND